MLCLHLLAHFLCHNCLLFWITLFTASFCRWASAMKGLRSSMTCWGMCPKPDSEELPTVPHSGQCPWAQGEHGVLGMDSKQESAQLPACSAGCGLPGMNHSAKIHGANSIFCSVFRLNASHMFLFHLVFLHWLFPSTAVQLGLNLGAADAPRGAGKAAGRNGQSSNSLRWQEAAASCKCAQTSQWQQK